MINLERLRSLHAISTHGSLHLAAESLHVSASAVSQQIAKLEREVGEPLIEKRGRGVILTDAGSLLARHAESALTVLRRAEAELDARRAVVSGTVTVGAFATAMRGLGPDALRDVGERYPRLDVRVSELEPSESVALVARGDLDLALAQDWAGQPLVLPDGLERAPLFDDVADIALPEDHRFATAGSVTLADLANEPWISWRAGTICHDWLMLTLRSHGREPRVQHNALEYATQLALVGAGLGVAVLPRLGRGPVPDNVRIVAVSPALTRHVYAVSRADASRRSAIAATVAAFRFAAERL
jgi:DNA-binding transcriptional LysR family regulator